MWDWICEQYQVIYGGGGIHTIIVWRDWENSYDDLWSMLL